MKLFTLLLSAVGLQAQPITTQFIDRVAIIESNFNYAAVGDSKKARGAWQLHEGAYQDAMKWYEITNGKNESNYVMTAAIRPWKDCAHDPYISRIVATYYFKLLEHRFNKRGIKPTQLQLYMAYNMGFSGAALFEFNPHALTLPPDRYATLRRAELILNK